MHGLVMLDEDNEVIRPSIIWCDQRTGGQVEEIADYAAGEVDRADCQSAADRLDCGKNFQWVKSMSRRIIKMPPILSPKDYIRQVLTGVFATEVSDASGMRLWMCRASRWSEEVLRALDIDRSLLGEVYESCEITGTLLPEIAERTGLNADTIVVGGAGDNAAAGGGDRCCSGRRRIYKRLGHPGWYMPTAASLP